MREYSIVNEFGTVLNVEPILTYVHAWHYRRVWSHESDAILRITWTGEDFPGQRPLHMEWDEYCEVIEEILLPRELHVDSEF